MIRRAPETPADEFVGISHRIVREGLTRPSLGIYEWRSGEEYDPKIGMTVEERFVMRSAGGCALKPSAKVVWTVYDRDVPAGLGIKMDEVESLAGDPYALGFLEDFRQVRQRPSGLLVSDQLERAT